MKIKFFLLILMGFMLMSRAEAQDFYLKSNLLYDGVGALTLGAEMPVSSKWSVELDVSYRPWNRSDDKKRKIWFAQPEARYWLCRVASGHFFGGHLLGGQYNVGKLDNNINFLGTNFSLLTDNRFQGWFVGAGLSYGYAWMLNRYWNLEAEIGFGYAYTVYDMYECGNCGSKLKDNAHHNYVGPTKAAINLVYSF
jgi:hypothetical protein